MSSEENRSLPEHVRGGFARRMRLCRHASVAQPESGHRLLVLRTGALKAERLSRSGDVEAIGFHFPGDTIALPARTQVPTLLTALSPAELCEIDIDKAAQSVPDGVGFLRAAVEVAMQQIVAEQHRSETFRTGSARDRLAAFLACCAERSSLADGADLALPMSREDLARYLAMRPETLSRAIADLRSEGRIAVPSRSVVRLLTIGAGGS